MSKKFKKFVIIGLVVIVLLSFYLFVYQSYLAPVKILWGDLDEDSYSNVSRVYAATCHYVGFWMPKFDVRWILIKRCMYI